MAAREQSVAGGLTAVGRSGDDDLGGRVICRR